MTVYDKERAQINVEVDVGLRDKLKEYAVESDRSFAAEVRQALRHWVLLREGKK